MKHYVLSIAHGVADVGAATAFCSQLPGFQSLPTEAGRALLANGAVTLTLFPDPNASSATTLALSVPDLDSSLNELLALPGVALAGGVVQVSPLLREQRLTAPHHFELLLQCRITEDDLAEPIPLPTSLDWSEEALQAARRMVDAVPHQFRDIARQRSVARAEELTIERGDVTVEVAEALRGMAEGTPRMQLVPLRDLIEEMGYDSSIPLKGMELDE